MIDDISEEMCIWSPASSVYTFCFSFSWKVIVIAFVTDVFSKVFISSYDAAGF